MVQEHLRLFEFPKGFKELRVLEEKLTVNRKPVYKREMAQSIVGISDVAGV